MVTFGKGHKFARDTSGTEARSDSEHRDRRLAPNTTGSKRKTVDGRERSGRYKKVDGVTEKQAKFAEAVVTTKDMVTAYEAVYDAGKMRKGNIIREASRLMDRNAVQAQIKSNLDQIGETSGDAEANLIKRLVIQGLKGEALNPKNQGSVRVRAWELLGKMTDVGLYGKEPSIVDISRTAADIEAELLRRLKGLMVSSDTKIINH